MNIILYEFDHTSGINFDVQSNQKVDIAKTIQKNIHLKIYNL